MGWDHVVYARGLTHKPSPNGEHNGVLQESIDSLNNISIEGNSFMGGSFSKDKATMPPRFSGIIVSAVVQREAGERSHHLSLLLVWAAVRETDLCSTQPLILSPGAEQLAKISGLFKSGLISNSQRGR